MQECSVLASGVKVKIQINLDRGLSHICIPFVEARDVFEAREREPGIEVKFNYRMKGRCRPLKVQSHDFWAFQQREFVNDGKNEGMSLAVYLLKRAC